MKYKWDTLRGLVTLLTPHLRNLRVLHEERKEREYEESQYRMNSILHVGWGDS